MRTRLALLALVVAPLLPACAEAQVRPSEHGTVSQQIGATTITLDYDRPGARGRELFGDGKVVHWGEVWTPGANWATTFDTDRDVRIDGHPLPKGKYSLWLIPQAAPAPWTLVFAKTARRFHTRPPGSDDEQLRVAVRLEPGSHMETLAWYFPIVTPDGAVLRMHWGTTIVPVPIAAEMTTPETLADERRRPYVGTYHVRVSPTAGRAPYDVDVVVADVKGSLEARTQPAGAFGDGALNLVPVADRRFHVAAAQLPKLQGQAYIAPGLMIVFDVAGDRARAVELVSYDGSIVGRGPRTN